MLLKIVITCLCQRFPQYLYVQHYLSLRQYCEFHNCLHFCEPSAWDMKWYISQVLSVIFFFYFYPSDLRNAVISQLYFLLLFSQLLKCMHNFKKNAWILIWRFNFDSVNLWVLFLLQEVTGEFENISCFWVSLSSWNELSIKSYVKVFFCCCC